MQKATMLAAMTAMLLCSCAGGMPSAAGPLPAHQAEASPEMPKPAKQQGGSDGAPTDGSKKTKLSFSIPPSWKRAPAEAVKAPWLAGFMRHDVRGLILMDFNVHSSDPAAKAAKDVHDHICVENDWKCDDVVPLPSGSGASFTFSTDENTRGKICFRDLDGDARSQFELFGMWSKDEEARAAKDFDIMISTAAVE